MFFNELNKFNSLKPRKECKKKKKVTVPDNVSELYNEYIEIYFDQQMADNVSELYNEYIEIYFDQQMAFSDVRKRNLGSRYDPTNLFLETYNYDVWFENKESNDTTKSDEETTDLLQMPELKDDEEVKEGKE